MRSSALKTFILLFAIFVSSCQENKGLQEGNWRGTLKTKSGVEIPFNFSIRDSAGKKTMYILNGKERFRVNDITIKNDSVSVQMPLFDSEIKAECRNNLQGQWIKHLPGKDISMDFSAQHGISWRFFDTKAKPKFNVSGRWTTTFIDSNDHDTTVAIGEFKQSGNALTGTFLTTTGDYRYLQGTVTENKIFLSAFNGSAAYLFTAKVENNNTISEGKFYSGYSSIENWSATRDEKAMLPDAYSLTTLKPGYKKIDFTFPDLNGDKVSLSDNRFKNKVIIVQLLGSWCPNCMDETAYLAPLYKRYKNKDFDIVGLAYERTKDFNRSRKSLEHLKDRFDVQYPILITGFTNNKDEVLKSLPMLNDFKAFPTTIIIGKNGEVQKIHTGFSGPGTGEHYTEFTQEFEQLIDHLLTEK